MRSLFCIYNLQVTNNTYGDFMKRKNSINFFAKRSASCFILIVCLFLSAVLRVSIISMGKYNEANSNYTTYKKINVSRLRGTIYDCNMVPITNSKAKLIAAVSATPNAIIAISSQLDSKSRKDVLDELKKNFPVVCTVDNPIKCDGITTTQVYNNSDNNLPACHIIGYTDSTGHGVTGLQRAYDDLLYSEEWVKAVFEVNGKGQALRGIKPFFENNTSVVNDGVVTTIDINIQKAVDEICTQLNSGCVVVADAKNGKIRALSSAPTFEINNLAQSLNKSNSPMINRALSVFNVGSVFKPCVAAAAIEGGFSYHRFNCEGKLKILDRDFRCHKLTGHGEMNLCDSLAQSCNCFFYDVAIKMGGKKIYNKASSLSISSDIYIADNLYAKKGSLPITESLENQGTLANFSIGQGNLTASPIAVLNLYLAIAGDGSYRLPSIVEMTIKNGKKNEYILQNPTRVMSESTAKTLREYLKSVITEGTGEEAKPQFVSAAGKTSTAQTGRYYENGQEITNSWFCGFFPADNPQYVVVAMSDSHSNVSTASIFAQIADSIYELKYKNVEIED